MPLIERFEFEGFAIDWLYCPAGEVWHCSFNAAWKGLGYSRAENARYHLEDTDYYVPYSPESFSIDSHERITFDAFLHLISRSTKPNARKLHRQGIRYLAQLYTKGYVDLTGTVDELKRALADEVLRSRKALESAKLKPSNLERVTYLMLDRQITDVLTVLFGRQIKSHEAGTVSALLNLKECTYKDTRGARMCNNDAILRIVSAPSLAKLLSAGHIDGDRFALLTMHRDNSSIFRLFEEPTA